MSAPKTPGSGGAEVDISTVHDKAFPEGRVAFWLVSAVWGTLSLFAIAVVTLSIAFTVAGVRDEGGGFGDWLSALFAAVFWAGLGILVTCYFSIPLATLAAGGCRLGIRGARRRRHTPVMTVPAPMPEPLRLFNRAGLFTLVDDPSRGHRELRIPVGNSMTDYDEFFRLTDRQFSDFADDPIEAKSFADECRQREHDDLLRLAPGRDRGTPWIPDESVTARFALMFYDTTTSAPAGYALGFHAKTHAHYLSIPFTPRDVNGTWMHFAITYEEYSRMTSDADIAMHFAAKCRAGDHDDRRIGRDEAGGQ